jgi:hypothetical protein|nr:DUF4079 domain-containing protein [Chroogloeocystis siderophila]
MVTGAIGGVVITYLSAGEISVNAHLFVGLAMTALIAISAALAPVIQHGSNWARYIHTGINLCLVAFFSWQLLTGLQIVQ